MTFYSNWGYRFSTPQDLLRNEWVIFLVVFLISFSMVYIALVNFFHKKASLTPFERLMGVRKDDSGAKGPLAVISICTALMISAAFSRYDFISNYVGVGAALGVFIFSLIVFAILSLPFYRALEKNLGFLAGPLFVFIVWFVLKFFLPDSLVWEMSYNLRDVYYFLVDPIFLWFLIPGSLVIGFLLNKFVKPVRP